MIVVGSVEQTQPSLQDLKYQVAHADGNISELKRTVQMVDSNYSLKTKRLISLPSNPVKAISPSFSGLTVIEEISSQESVFSKYANYDELSNPQYKLHFKAFELHLNNGILLKDGGYLITGIFRGDLVFNHNLVVTKGNQNAFVLKLNSSFERVWFKTISCSAELNHFITVEMDDQSIQLGGNFSEELFLDAQSWRSLGESDNFILKMSASGTFNWLKTYGGKGDEKMIGLVPLPGGSFVTASNTTKSSEPSYCTLVKFDSNGDIVDGVSLSQTNDNYASSLTYNNNNLYLGGQFEKAFELNGSILSTEELNLSGFIYSLTDDFVVNWSVSFPSTGGTEVIGVEVDPFGYPLVLFGFDGNLSLDNGLLTRISEGESDLMVLKLDPSDGGIIWQTPIATSGDDTAISFAIDKYGMLLVGASLQSPFELDGQSVTQGNQFLLQLESEFWGSPLFQPVNELIFQENLFFHQNVLVASPSFVRMHLLESPSWMTFYDNKNGTGILGGIPVSTENKKAKIRAYTVDGGFSDLDLNFTVSSYDEHEIPPKSLPDYLSVINLGDAATVSITNSSLDGRYYVGGNFVGNLILGENNVSATGEKDGFLVLMEANGTLLNYIHFISAGSLNIGAALSAPNGDVFIIGHFSNQLRIGDFQVKGVGGDDLFIAHWGEDGIVKNLSVLGGPSNETFESAIYFQDDLYIAGLFEGTFSHDGHSVSSNGGKDGFVLQSSINDISSVSWIQSFGGIGDEKVSKLITLSDGRLVLSGTFQNNGVFGSVTHESSGMSDCFAAHLSSNGVWGSVFPLGGAGEDELTGLVSLSDNNMIMTGNFMGSLRFGNRKILSNGRRDGFIALFNEYGSSIYLDNFGGSGSDSIESISNVDGQVHFVGSFSNELAIAGKIFSSRGGRDSYIALFDTDGKVVLDAFQVGGRGEDVAIRTDSAFSGNILFSGISDGFLDANSSILTTGVSRNSYLAILTSLEDQNATIVPTLSPSPQSEIPPSTLYDYQFTTGPWPRGRDLALKIIEKPAWLNIELDEYGNGIVWGKSPALSGGSEKVSFEISSSLNGAIQCEWEIEVIASSKSISIVGEPTLQVSVDSQYLADFVLRGGSLENTLVYPVKVPSWLKLIRAGDNHFSLSGIAEVVGNHKVKLLAHKYIDQNSGYQDELIFEITVQPKIIENSSSLNIGGWRTSWLGNFHAFENSWSYHEDFAWVYFGESSQADNVWFWTQRWGWLWTSSLYWNSTQGEGFLYSSLSEDWLFFRRKQTRLGLPATVYSYDDKKWLPYE